MGWFSDYPPPPSSIQEACTRVDSFKNMTPKEIYSEMEPMDINWIGYILACQMGKDQL